MRRFLVPALFLLVASILIGGCAQKRAVVKEEPSKEEGLPARPEAVTPPGSKPPLREAPQKVEVVVEPIAPEGVTFEPMATDEMRGGPGTGIGGLEAGEETFPDIRFDYNQSEIRLENEAILRRLSTRLIDEPNTRLTIEGHCDERGTNEYNLALGEQRAVAVKRYLAASGVDPDRIATISYGEERPLDSGHDEGAWAKNRRAHFVLHSP